MGMKWYIHIHHGMSILFKPTFPAELYCLQSESSGSISKEHTHMSNIGRLIEDMEISLRSDLDALYIQKTNEVINSIRSLSQAPRQDDSHIKSLIGAVSKHGVARKIDSEV
jgi:capping protein beta